MAKKSQLILVLVFCFLLAVTASQIQIQNGLNKGDQRIAEIFDSSHYLDSTRILISFLKARFNLTSVPSPPAYREKAPDYRSVGNHLMSDGVTVPVFGSAAIWLASFVTDASDLEIMLAVQSLFNGVCTVAVAFFAYRVTGGSILWALATGSIWALYPSGVAASQRILTEIMCAMFLLLSVSLSLPIAEGKKRVGFQAFLAGLFFELLMLTKPVLLFSGLPIIAVALLMRFERKRPWPSLKLLACAGIGVATLTLCFMIFIKTSINQWSLIPQRAPLYNVICGLNVPLDGLSTVPQGPLSEDLARKQPLGFIFTSFVKDPLHTTDLALRKMGRLFELPWNDFRRSVFGVSLTVQQVWHRMWLALGLMATPLAFAFVVNGFGSRFSSKRREEDGGAFLRGRPALDIGPHNGVGGRVSLKKVEALSTGATAVAEPTKRESGAAVYARLREDSAEIYLLSAAIAVFAGHFAYMPFEGVPRYGFTAMPFLLLLAVWLTHKAASESKLKALVLAFLPVVALIALAHFSPIQPLSNVLNSPTSAMVLIMVAEGGLMVLTGILTASIFGRSRLSLFSTSIMCAFCLTIMLLNAYREEKSCEWAAKLKPGERAEQRVFLPSTKIREASPGWALLLIDGSESLREAEVTVNGHKLLDAPNNIYQFYAKKYDIYSYMQMLSSLIGLSPDRVRQWRAVEVPVSFLKFGQENSIVVSPGSDRSLTIYGDFERPVGARYTPTFEFLSHSMIYCSIDGIEWRPTMPPRNQDTERRSILHTLKESSDQDLSTFPGKQTGSFRMLFAIPRGGKAVDRLGNPEKTNFSSLELEPHYFYPVLKKGDPHEIKFQYMDASRGRPIENFARLAANAYRSTMLIDMGQLTPEATHVRVRFTASARANPSSASVITISARGVEEEANKHAGLTDVDPLTGTANDVAGSPYTCLGRLKPEILTLPDSVVSVPGKDGWQPVTIETQFPTRVVRGRLKELALEVFPIVKGQCNLILKNANLEVKEEIKPDLAGKEVVYY